METATEMMKRRRELRPEEFAKLNRLYKQQTKVVDEATTNLMSTIVPEVLVFTDGQVKVNYPDDIKKQLSEYAKIKVSIAKAIFGEGK